MPSIPRFHTHHTPFYSKARVALISGSIFLFSKSSLLVKGKGLRGIQAPARYGSEVRRGSKLVGVGPGLDGAASACMLPTLFVVFFGATYFLGFADGGTYDTTTAIATSRHFDDRSRDGLSDV